MLASLAHRLRAAALTLALALVAALAADAVAAAKAPVFKASLYGIQRYKQDASNDQPADPYCFDDFGSSWQDSTVKLSSVRPVRVSLSRRSGMPVVSHTRTATGADVDVKATFEAKGDWVAQHMVCDDGPMRWEMVESPEINVCPATELVGMGMFFTSTRRGRIAVVGGQERPPAEPQLLECPWGDQSFDLYEASARFDAQPLLDGEAKEMQVILRGREVDRFADPMSRSTYERITTVYLTIRRTR